MSDQKPDCYKCQYRADIPGNAHSQCKHPAFEGVNAALGLLATIRASQRGGPIESANKEVTVKGNQHGIRSGWFMHPLNFDPVWLEACNGFKPVEQSNAVSGAVSQAA
jgi:hypothetical protein